MYVKGIKYLNIHYYNNLLKYVTILCEIDSTWYSNK